MADLAELAELCEKGRLRAGKCLRVGPLVSLDVTDEYDACRLPVGILSEDTLSGVIAPEDEPSPDRSLSVPRKNNLDVFFAKPRPFDLFLSFSSFRGGSSVSSESKSSSS